MFYELGKSDREIGELFGVDRTSMVHFRKTHNIKTPISTGRLGELKAIFQLEELGFNVKDMNEEDCLSEFDLLVNKKIKIEVKTSNLSNDNTYTFGLSEKPRNKNRVSKNRIKLKSGRTKKIYRNTADYFILVGMGECKPRFWIVPTNHINDQLNIIRFSKNSSRYKEYKNNFELLRDGGDESWNKHFK